MQQFEDLKVWQKARWICAEIQKDVSSGSFESNRSLIYQIQGSSGSCMDNIAEGYERDGNAELKQFLSIAKASIGETRSQLYRALDSGFISEDRFNVLKEACVDLSRMLNGFMRYLMDSNHKGNKFKEPEYPYGTNSNDEIESIGDPREVNQP